MSRGWTVQGHIVFQLCSGEILYVNVGSLSEFMTPSLDTAVKPATILIMISGCAVCTKKYRSYV